MLDYPRNFGNVAIEGLKRTTIGRCTILLIKILGILSAISAIQPLPPLDDTTEHTEGEELGVNICCSSASALCQRGNNDGKSWNSLVVSLVTGLVARKSSRSKSCRPKPELNALLSL